VEQLKKSRRLTGKVLTGGEAEGEIAGTNEMLSFWGGFDASSGIVIDRRHPLYGKSLKGKILVMPCGKGSSTGSPVLLDAIMTGNAPAGLLLNKTDEILALGAVVCEEFFQKKIPIIVLNDPEFALAVKGKRGKIIKDGTVILYEKGE
jgi:predicted aconitase with swiveling domain